MKQGRKAVALLLSAAAGLGLLLAGQGVQAGPDARGIMDKVALGRKLDGSEAVVKMKVFNEKNEARERKISMATKLYEDGKTEKRVYKFLEPADVKGTGILVFDYQTKADDIWIFLPALRKTRRVVTSESSKSFMGSEFSYADLNIPSLDDYKYTYTKDESAGGETCWVIDVVPASDAIAKAEGYKKKTYWVSQKTYTIRKGLFYDLNGKLLKEFTTKNIKELDTTKHRFRAMTMEIVNKQNGRRSVFETEKISFAPNTKDEFFETRYLERQ